MSSKRTYDLIVFGATGFTGKLVAEYLLNSSTSPQSLRWAIAGRDSVKLQSLRSELLNGYKVENKGVKQDIGVVIADVGDSKALHALAQSTVAVISTVGPFIKV